MVTLKLAVHLANFSLLDAVYLCNECFHLRRKQLV